MALLCAAALCSPAFAQEDPLKPGEHTAQINGVKQWYKVSGAGPVCLMPSPAWGMSSDLYIKTFKPMEKIFTIVYLDSRACGRSDPAPSLTQYTWADLDADLDALRAHLGQEQVWVMGHSEGAMEAIHYACKHPKRISGAVLLSVGGIDGKNLGRDGDTIIASHEGDPRFAEALKVTKEHDDLPKTGPELAKFLKAQLPLYWYDPAKIAKYAEVFGGGSSGSGSSSGGSGSGSGSGGGSGAGKVSALEGKEASHRGDLSDITAADYKNLTAPVLIVSGDSDWVCPLDGATRLHLALHNSKLLVIEQCGHFTWMEQPDVFNTRVPEFLAALGLGSK
jgi:proline iminopeptidase